MNNRNKQLKHIITKGGMIHNQFPPLSLSITLTDQCNLKCRYCWRNNTSRYSTGLSFDKLEAVIFEAYELGITKISLLGGGEPLVREHDLLRLIKQIKGLGMVCDLITNFTLPSDYFFDKLENLRLDCILISMDSPVAETNDYFRGRRVTEKVIANIQQLNKLRKKPPVCILAVLTDKSMHDIPAMLEFARENEVEQIIYCKLTDEYEHYQEHQIKDKHRLHRYIKDAVIQQTSGVKTNLRQFTPEIIDNLDNLTKLHKTGITCSEPWREITLNADGSITPCCNVKHTIGNVLQQSLDNIWYGRQYNTVRQHIAAGHKYDECHKCDIDYYYKTANIFNE